MGTLGVKDIGGWLSCCLCASLLAACGGGGGSNTPSITVTVMPSMASVMVGQQIQLAATTTNATGPVMWSSSNAGVATVNATGLVMALSLGQVTITATSGGGSGTATLTTTTGIVFATVSAGGNHTCGLTPAGIAYCWGDNSSGQLGNGTTTTSATPAAVSGQLTFATLSAGAQHTCGITTYSASAPPPVGGEMYCWGNNGSGQLGNGTTTSSTTPTAVSGGNQFFALSAGTSHTCGVTFDDALYCWGDNSSGQLGNGSLTNSSVPVISTSAYWQAVSAGNNHTCAVAYGGGLSGITFYYCWGDNSSGQLGNGTTSNSATPVRIASSGGPDILSAGTGYTCEAGPLATFPDDSILVSSSSCWGDNSVGQLGNGTTMNSALPVAIASGLSLDSVSAGAVHACGLVYNFVLNVTEIATITTYCWGDNASGQLGNGTTMSSATPVIVAGGLDFATVSAGARHTCAMNAGNPPNITSMASGAVYCWGDNTYGQLGNGWTTSSSVPVNVAGSP